MYKYEHVFTDYVYYVHRLELWLRLEKWGSQRLKAKVSINIQNNNIRRVLYFASRSFPLNENVFDT